MKIAAIAMAAALATGSAAFAAEHSYSQERDMSRDRPAATSTHRAHDRMAANDENRSHDGIMAKTKRFFHGIGDKMRGAGSKMAGATHTPDPNARHEDTRAMGAAGDTHDSARQRRMDDAYGNYERKQHHDEKR